jgi:inorganic pyrophosphatase
MKNPFHAIPATVEGNPAEINVILEISLGDNVKYEYDKNYGIVMMDRILKTPMPYPFNYGLIPSTWNEFDNDPLDVILLGNNKLIPGVLVPSRVVGMLSVDDNGERDDKVLAVPTGDSSLEHIKDLSDIDPKTLESMIYFMEHYKDLEKKTVKVTGTTDAKTAQKFIVECQECYAEKF